MPFEHEAFCNECEEWVPTYPRLFEMIEGPVVAYLCDDCYPYRPTRFFARVKEARRRHAYETRRDYGVHPVDGMGLGPRVWEQRFHSGRWQYRKFAGSTDRPGLRWPYRSSEIEAEPHEDQCCCEGVYVDPDEEPILSYPLAEIAWSEDQLDAKRYYYARELQEKPWVARRLEEERREQARRSLEQYEATRRRYNRSTG